MSNLVTGAPPPAIPQSVVMGSGNRPEKMRGDDCNLENTAAEAETEYRYEKHRDAYYQACDRQPVPRVSRRHAAQYRPQHRQRQRGEPVDEAKEGDKTDEQEKTRYKADDKPDETHEVRLAFLPL